MTATEGASTSVHKDTTLQTPFRHSDTLSLAVLLALSCCLFSNGLYGEFVFDDGAALGNNNDTKSDLTPLRDVFLNDFWGTPVRDVRSHRSYRPTVILTFRLQHYLMGYRHDATTLHVVNYIMAYINVCLVYYLARLYMKRHVDSADGVADRPLHVAWRRCAIPFAAALLFLAHPVHVDSVTSIVGRCELMCCFFGLCALFVEHAYLCVWGRGWHVHVGCVLLSTVLMILSVTSKDSGIAYCGVFVVHAVGIYCWKCASLRRTIMCVILSVAQVVGYFGFRMYALGALSLHVKDMRRTETPQYFVPPGVWHWLAIRWVVTMKNLELLFFPTKLCCEYSFDCIPHLASLSDERVPMFCAVTLAVLCYVGALVYRVLRYRSRGASVQLVAVLWGAILYAPVSHFFVQVGTFIAERCLYSSSVGVVLLYAFVSVPAKVPESHLGWVRCCVLCALVVFWLFVSHRRNPAWNTSKELFTAAVEVCPNGAKGHSALGIQAKIDARGIVTEESFRHMERAYSLDSELVHCLHYLAVFTWNNRNLKDAYQLMRKCAAKLEPDCVDSYPKLRDMIFPDLPTSLQNLDYATFVERVDAKAMYFAMAALSRVLEGEPCPALSLYRKAVDRWRSVNVFWDSIKDSKADDKVFFCGILDEYADALKQCVTEGDDDDYLPELVAEESLEELLNVTRTCYFSWSTFRDFWDGRIMKNTLERFAYRLGEASKHLLETAPLLEDAKLQVELEQASLELQLRRYCHVNGLLKNKEVLDRIPERHADEVAALEANFTKYREEWRASIVEEAALLTKKGVMTVWGSEDELFQCEKFY